MQTSMPILTAALTVAFMEFGVSAGQAQADFCEYRYSHCRARCASRELNRVCFTRCRVNYHHCKPPSPHLGDLTGTR
jgi:hypothetical protein